MKWNYRIMKRSCHYTGEVYYALTEIYYKNNNPYLYSERDEVISDTPEGVVEVLKIMLSDAQKQQDILTEKDFKK